MNFKHALIATLLTSVIVLFVCLPFLYPAVWTALKIGFAVLLLWCVLYYASQWLEQEMERESDGTEYAGPG